MRKRAVRLCLVLLLGLACCHIAYTEHTPSAGSWSKSANAVHFTASLRSGSSKSIESFAWEKRPGEDRTRLYINGEEYTFKLLADGCAVVHDIGFSHYVDALAALPQEALPDDLYTFLNT